MPVKFQTKEISRVQVGVVLFEKMCTYYKKKHGISNLVEKTNKVLKRTRKLSHKSQIIQALYKEALGKQLQGKTKSIIFAKFGV